MKAANDRRLTRQKGASAPGADVDTSGMDAQQSVLHALEQGGSLAEFVREMGPSQPLPRLPHQTAAPPVTDALPPPAKPRKKRATPPPEKRLPLWWEEHAQWRVPGPDDFDDGRPYSETIHDYDPFEWRLREEDDDFSD